jgi:Peptidase A4 family
MKRYLSALIVIAVIVIISFSALTPLNVYATKTSAHSHPINRVKRSTELVGANLRAQVYSTNWAGYAVSAPGVSNVVGTWIQPSVSCASGGYVATWVGIDGYSSSTVEQTGTLVECISGVAFYYAWYEFYPAALTTISSISVSPGNVFTARVYPSGGSDYTTVLTDVTTGASYTATASVSSAQDNSAEWITEAPSSSSGVLPLANFGTADFGPAFNSAGSSDSATIGGTTGSINSFGSAVEQIDMVNSANKVICLTSALQSDGQSFTDTFQSGTSTTTTTTTTTSSSSTTTTHSSTTTSSLTTTTTTTTTTTSSTSTSQPTLKVIVTSITGFYYYVFVSFTVTNTATGKGVSATASAVLTAPNGAQSTGSLTTGSNGRGEFEILALQDGTYTMIITASASGYTSGSTTIQFILTGPVHDRTVSRTS